MMGNTFKYTAWINQHDRDYHYSPGCDFTIQVNSWEEAQNYCDKSKDPPYSYMVLKLINNQTRKTITTYEAYMKMVNRGEF